MKLNVQQIETRIKELIESLAAIFQDKHFTEPLLHGLVNSMEANLTHNGNGEEVLPDQFIISLSKVQKKKLDKAEHLLPALINALEQIALENDQTFHSPPRINFQTSGNLHDKEFKIRCFFSERSKGTTQAFVPCAHESCSTGFALLLRNGSEPFRLNASVTNIGRRADNQIVISDPAISRMHAQIRFSQGILVHLLQQAILDQVH